MPKHSWWRNLTDNVWSNAALLSWTFFWSALSVYVWEFHIRQIVM